MYDTDKYFDFDFTKEKSATKQNSKKKQQKKQSLMLLLLAGIGAVYYFLVYLPEEEVKKLETQLQAEINRIKNAQPDDVAEMLTTLQSYLPWVNGTDYQKKALTNKQTELNEALQWLQSHQKTPQQIEDEYFLKGRIWSLPVKSWADKVVKKISSVLVGRYNEDTKLFPNGDKHEDFHFSRSAIYDIFFPPSMEEFYKLGKQAKKSNCDMLTKNEDLIWSSEIQNWYNQVKREKPPWRGKSNPTTRKDNSALFYGAPGTGKSATLKKLCIEANECPLVIIKGSSLTPTKQDYDAGIAPLQKFVYTISELEWSLVKIYGMERENNGEVRYILFVDECDQTSNNLLLHDPNKLRFLKDCWEGSESSREKETQNLWIFATNHLGDIEPAAYREGRLSNLLDFSWNWYEFKKYFDDARSNPSKYKLPSGFTIPDLPQRWREIDTLNKKDNELVNRFNRFSFVADFIGYDPEKTNRTKFWETFIRSNSDAKVETEEDELDDQGNSTGRKVKIDIEIGELFQFFWQKKDSASLASYRGKFESPRIPETAEVLNDNLPNLWGIGDTIAKSSDALNNSLEFIREEIEKTKRDLQISIASQNNSGIQSQIQQLRQQLGDLAQEVRRR